MRPLVFACALWATAAAAQVEDDLPALPTKPKPKPARPKPKPAPKKPVVVEDDLPALPQAKAELLVKLSTQVKGAKLTIDEREIGTLPLGAQSLTAGEHVVSVRRLGYALFSKKVTLVPNRTQELNVTLDANAAVLSVTSDVAGAKIYVNGRLAGTAPLVDLEVPPGSIELSARREGYNDGSQMLSVRAGRDYPIEVKLGAPIASTVVATNTDTPVNRDLTPSSVDVGTPVVGTEARYESEPIYKKWWFWVGAVVVAGAVATGAGLAADRASGPRVVQLKRADYPCQQGGKMCDGWINEPMAIVPRH